MLSYTTVPSVAGTSKTIKTASLCPRPVFDADLRGRSARLVEGIYELTHVGQDLQEDAARGEEFVPKLEVGELLFHDVLHACRHAGLEAGEDTLAQIARDIVKAMRTSPTNWHNQADVRAKLRTMVKRLLKKYRYPPEDQVEARRRIIEQMEILAETR